MSAKRSRRTKQPSEIVADWCFLAGEEMDCRVIFIGSKSPRRADIEAVIGSLQIALKRIKK